MKKTLMRHLATRFLALTAACLAGVATVGAQNLQATQKHYSTEDGLSSNAISYIAQDGYGYLWISTWNGLVRFDGYNFYNYKTGPTSHIPHLHNRIYDVAIDRGQNVWMRMYDNMVFVMKRSEDRLVDPFEGIMGHEDFRTKLPITVTSNGDVLIVVDGVGIYKMHVEDNGRISAQLVTMGDTEVTSMAEGYQNDVWLGTKQGIHRIDAANLTVERKGYFTDEQITCMFSNGFNVYAGTESGKIVSFAYGQQPKVLRSEGRALISIFVDSRDLIWFSDSRFGACYYDPATGAERVFMQDVKVPDYDGYGGFFREVGGIVWVRMNHGGYGYYDRTADEVRYFHNDPVNPWNLSNTVNASLELEEGVIWESTSRRGLDKLEIIKNSIERKRLVDDKPSSLDNEIRALYCDTLRNTVMMANKQGTLYLLGKDGSRTAITSDQNGNPLGRVYGIAGDSKGRFWLSSKDNGLFCMTYADGRYTLRNYRHQDDDSLSLGDNRAYLSQEDLQGNIWVATYGGGVNMLVAGTNRFIKPEDMKGYPRRAFRKVRTITIDREGTIWAGTTDGVLLLDYTDGVVHARTLEASTIEPDRILQSNDIVCMARDAQGHIWLGTNGGGLSREAGKDMDGRYVFDSFGTKDGLPSEEIRAITFDRRGSVWFSADHTICSFDPEKVIFSSFSSLEGVDETLCSEASALTLPNGHILFGTLDGYYVVDQNKLINQTGSLLKLRLTDFWLDGELQSPRLTDNFSYYVPEARHVTLPNGTSEFAFRFASLNYQLQHRIHYQYKLEGYDAEWQNATPERIATYIDVPTGTYRLKVRAFLLESPDNYDECQIEIKVSAPFLLSPAAIWLYVVLFIVVGIALLLLAQKRVLRDVTQADPLLKKDEKETKTAEEEEVTDAYEIIED